MEFDSRRLESLLRVVGGSREMKDPRDIGRWRLENGDEIPMRLSAFGQIRENLVPDVEFDVISELIRNEFSTLLSGHDSVYAQAKSFFVENAEDAHDLIREIANTSEPDAKAITKWVKQARDIGLTDRANAGSVVSILLTALYPERFIDYKEHRTKAFARYFGLSSFQSTATLYGQRVIDAGRMASEFTEKYPVGDYFGELPNPNLIVGGLAQLLKRFPLELKEDQTVWRVDLRHGATDDWDALWEKSVRQGILGFGWGAVDDLSRFADGNGVLRESKLRAEIDSQGFSQREDTIFKGCQRFYERISEGDIVVAHKTASMKSRVLGLGRVKSGYRFEEVVDARPRHFRNVDWRIVGKWSWADEANYPKHLGMGSILESSPTKEPQDFALLQKGLEKALGLNVLEFEGELPEIEELVDRTKSQSQSSNGNKMDVSERLTRQLHHQPNLILQGPPGTGKTYGAQKFIAELLNAAGKEVDPSKSQTDWQDQLGAYRFQNRADGDKPEEEDVVWDIVQMHPEYSYEDFVCGLQTNPEASEGGIHFEFQPGILLEMARLAEKRLERAPAEVSDVEGTIEQKQLLAKRPVVLILDEINRCNLPAVLGELILALEPDKRTRRVEGADKLKEGVGVRLQYDDNRKDSPEEPYKELTLPENLYIIGTMNTADRSIAMVDYAIRRRFRFLDVLPKTEVIEGAAEESNSSGFYRESEAAALAVNVMNDVNGLIDEPRLQVGHSYFLTEPNISPEDQWERLVDILEYEVGPLLREYAYEGHLGDSSQTKELTEDIDLGDWASTMVKSAQSGWGDGA